MHDADLFFPSTGSPQGFSTLATTQWDGNPEPIIRELLQNCLDASVATGSRTANIDFSIRDVAADDIPGLQSYKKHFYRAVEERERESQSGSEKLVIQRIREVLDAPRIRILCCRDNGIGLDPDRIERLLTEGNTDKSDKGAGAFGLGHLTAFAASDLRYIFYGGKSNGTSNGDVLSTVASAHAILASRTDDQGGGRGGHGYWLRGDLTLFAPSPYPDRAPPLVKHELDQIDGTGSVVIAIGFNDFRGESNPAEAIMRVAAKNFLLAIWQGRMVVRVQRQGGDWQVLDRGSLGEVLEREKDQVRAEQADGWLPGAQAYRSWRTLQEGRSVALDELEGVRLCFRLLDSRDMRNKESRVQVFRNGMWITNGADALCPRHFGGAKPFDAVLIADDGEFCRLVRGSEGPEHRKINRKLLGRKDRQRLLDLLRLINRELFRHVGTTETDEEFTPSDFAMFGDGTEVQAETVPVYRPRKGPDDNKKITTPVPTDESKDSVDPEKRGKRRTRRGAAPKAGRGAPGRTSALAKCGTIGTIDRVDVLWQPADPRTSSGKVGVRLRIPSGSDATCESPMSPKWLPILKIEYEDGYVKGGGRDKYEIVIDGNRRRFTVFPAEDCVVTDPNSIEVDIVRRNPTSDGA